MAKVREEGDANRYTVETEDGKDWIATLRINGELTLETQRALMALIAAAAEPFSVKLTSQGRQ